MVVWTLDMEENYPTITQDEGGRTYSNLHQMSEWCAPRNNWWFGFKS
jgi:hypothetical protein